MRKLIRRINEWDSPTVLKIYKHYVETSHCTPEETVPTLSDYIHRVDKYTYSRGFIMAEIDGETVGLCLLTENTYDPTDFFTANIEMYVKDGHIRRGIGSAMCSLMLDIMEKGNKKAVYARVPLPNDSAVNFYKKWGFTEKEEIKKSFTKFDKSYDVMVMEKVLNPVDKNALKPIKPYLIESVDYETARINAEKYIKER